MCALPSAPLPALPDTLELTDWERRAGLSPWGPWVCRVLLSPSQAWAAAGPWWAFSAGIPCPGWAAAPRGREWFLTQQLGQELGRREAAFWGRVGVISDCDTRGRGAAGAQPPSLLFALSRSTLVAGFGCCAGQHLLCCSSLPRPAASPQASSLSARQRPSKVVRVSP